MAHNLKFCFLSDLHLRRILCSELEGQSVKASRQHDHRVPPLAHRMADRNLVRQLIP